jgi:hypothetical protein
MPQIEAGIDPAAMTEEDLARWRNAPDPWLIRADVLPSGVLGLIAYSGGNIRGPRHRPMAKQG